MPRSGRRSGEYATFGTHVLQTVRTLGADPLAADEDCVHWFELVERPSSPGLGDVIDDEFEQSAVAHRLAALEQEVQRLPALEREVRQLKELLSQRAPTARAMSMLDALIGDYKPVGPTDEDGQFLAMALTEAEGE